MHSANNPLFAEGYLLNDNLPRLAAWSFLFASSENVARPEAAFSIGQLESGPSLASERNEEEAFPGDSALAARRLAALAYCRRYLAATRCDCPSSSS